MLRNLKSATGIILIVFFSIIIIPLGFFVLAQSETKSKDLSPDAEFSNQKIIWLNITQQDGFENYIYLDISKVNESRFAIYYKLNESFGKDIKNVKDGKLKVGDLKKKYLKDLDPTKFQNSLDNIEKYPIENLTKNIKVDVKEINLSGEGIIYVDVLNYDHKNMHKSFGERFKIGYNTITVETVESTNDVGKYPSTALDSNGVVHISHFDDTNDKLRYCNNTGGSWSCAEIESGGMSSCIAIDSNDAVHISHITYFSDILRYCNNTGGSWSCVVVDSTSVDNGGSSIALDSNDIVHISHFDETSVDLGYCNNTGGSWSCLVLDTTNTRGRDSSLAIDSNDAIHISHYGQSATDLRYCNNIGGSWTCSALDTTGIVGVKTSIAITSDDSVHISYQDDSNDDLKYCNNSGGGSFSCVVIDSTNQAGYYTSIATGPNDALYISHYEINWDYLRLCNKTDGNWSCATLIVTGSAPVSSRYLAIKKGRIVDSTSFSHAAHLSWYNNTNLIYINTTIFVSTCICPGLNNNWEIDMSEYCNITTDCNLGTGYLNFTGSGYVNCNATINTTNLGDPKSGNSLFIQDNCIIYVS